MSLLKDALKDKLTEEVDVEQKRAAREAMTVLGDLYDDIENLLDSLDDVFSNKMEKRMKTLDLHDKDFKDIKSACNELKPILNRLYNEDLDVILPGLEMTSKGEQ